MMMIQRSVLRTDIEFQEVQYYQLAQSSLHIPSPHYTMSADEDERSIAPQYDQ